MDRQKVFNLALKIFLFLSPIFFFKQFQLSLARGLFFILGTFVLFGISLSLEPKRKFSNIWLSLFLLLALIRIFFNNDFGNPQAEWFNFWMSCANFIYVFCGVLLFYVVYCYADESKEYLKSIVWVCAINSLLTFAQIFKGDFMWQHTLSICGFMENSSQLGQYSAMSLPILSYINPFLAGLALFTLIASRSVSPILASVVGVAFLGSFKGIRVRIKAGIGILLVLIGLLNFGYISRKFQCRPVMWQKTLKVALQKPYLGWGYGSFKEKVTKVKAIGSLGGMEYSRPHNDYLHTAQELGFPIVIVAGLFFVGLYKKFKLASKNELTLCLATSIIVVLVNMNGQTLIRYASVAGTFIILLALFCKEVDDARSI